MSKRKSPAKGNKFSDKRNVSVTSSVADKKKTAEVMSIESNFWEKLLLPIILLTGFILFQYAFDKKLMMVGDDTDYYSLGKALYEGKGYVSPMSPELKPHTHFPPGFPFFLSIVMIFTKSVLALKKAGLILYLVTLFALYKIYGKITDNKWLVAMAVVFTAANPLILRYSNALMSEMLFVCLSFLSLLFFLSIKDDKEFYKQPYFYLTILGLAASYYTRSVAIVFIASFAFYDLINKKLLRAAVMVAGTVLLLLPWQIRNSGLGGKSYFDYMKMKNPYDASLGNLQGLGDIMDRVTVNFKRHFAVEVPNMLNANVPIVRNDAITTSHWIWGAILLALTVWGFIALKKYKWLLLAIFGSTMTIMLVYPEVWSGNRFIIHLVPVLGFVILYGLFDLLQRLIPVEKQRLRTLSPLLFIPLLFLNKPVLAKMHQLGEIDKFAPSFENFIEASKWLAVNSPDTSMVSSRKPSISFLYSKRYSTQFGSTTDKTKMLNAFDQQGVDYVIVDALGYASTGKYLIPLINSEPEKFKKVYESGEPKTYIFEYHNELGYKGELTDNKRNGKGTYTWANGSRYEGEWKDDKRHGKGVMYMADGARYEGEFVNDTFNGKGTYYDKNGRVVFSGNWKSGQPAR